MKQDIRLIFSTNESDSYVDGTEFNDSDLKNIPNSTITLNLELSNVTDIGIKNLPKLPNLICIDLDSTKITDKSLKKIGEYESLREIWIEQTQITDMGIKYLTELKKLEFISILDTEITEKGVELLRTEIPKIKIH
ncbi:hypothetical protein [Winogradskyella sp. A3E31]|uniref:hypothetical protein n=1 Tax=Winogradskyella sp. A3E31 TaxID=3349637 RepID=UPI00398BBBC6